MTTAKSHTEDIRREKIATDLAVWQGTVDAKLQNLQANHVELKSDVGELKRDMGLMQVKLENVAVKAGLWGAVGAVVGSGAISGFGVMLWYIITKVK